jgi:hypothetical protein
MITITVEGHTYFRDVAHIFVFYYTKCKTVDEQIRCMLRQIQSEHVK